MSSPASGDGAVWTLPDAWAWLDAIAWDAVEEVSARSALGRVLAAPVVAAVSLPDRDQAAWNGWSLCAVSTEGASEYSPVDASAAAGSPRPVMVLHGDAMPDGADAVVPAEAIGTAGQIAAAVAAGYGVLHKGGQVRAGSEILAVGRRLSARDVALLAALDTERVTVRRQPVVSVFMRGPRHGCDCVTPLLHALLSQAGGIVTVMPTPDRADVSASLTETACDVAIIAGRGGEGPDDDTALAVRDAHGRIDARAVALRPGRASGLGWQGGHAVLLLPGEPLACLASASVLAGRLVRRLSGRSNPPPCSATLSRKLVSGVGYADFARVRLDGGMAEPLAGLETAGIAGACRADGYVLVPEASEGYAAGSVVSVQLFDGAA